MTLQGALPVLPGTSKILLASVQGEELGPGSLLGVQSIIGGGQRTDSLVALKNNSQASRSPSDLCDSVALIEQMHCTFTAFL